MSENSQTPPAAQDFALIADASSVADRTGEVIREVAAIVDRSRKADLIEIIEPGTQIAAPVIVSADGGIQPLPSSYFDSYRDNPKYRAGNAAFTQLPSFIGHVNRFKTANSVVFAQDSRTDPALKAVYDYHEAVNVGSDGVDDVAYDEALPHFMRHTASYRFPLSDEWIAWTENNSQPMAMKDFAYFIEDRIVDIFNASGDDDLNDDIRQFMKATKGTLADAARLLDISRNLQINEASTVKNMVNISSGETEILFSSEHQDAAGQKLVLPSVFIIAIPVFKTGDCYKIAARFRYRKKDGGVVFWYELYRTDQVIDHAFNEACEKVSQETELPLFYGSAEK